MNSLKPFAVICLLFLSLVCSAQVITINDPAISKKYPFVNSIFNQLKYSSCLDSFYQKLYLLKKTGNGVVNIVHIGDSHLQAGFISSVVRNSLQDYFGNAGRGLVFPYQLAESNSPDDISCSSNTRWQYNRIAHPEIPLKPGISGFGITSSGPGASIHIYLKNLYANDPSFSSIRLFVGPENRYWNIKPDESARVYESEKALVDSMSMLVRLGENVSGFYLTNTSPDSGFSFYGASLTNDKPGVLYHTIGVNGSRYDQYNIAPLFWQQLPALEADLYIVSLGTNEAQAASFSENTFNAGLNEFLGRLRKSSPQACILITTQPDSYKSRRSNPVLKQVNQSLINYCQKNQIASWDLYQVTGGYGSAHNWSRRSLMNRDKIHYTAEGYRLQGSLLFNALGKGYNTYLEANQLEH